MYVYVYYMLCCYIVDITQGAAAAVPLGPGGHYHSNKFI